jgi:hypothetical protein
MEINSDSKNDIYQYYNYKTPVIDTHVCSHTCNCIYLKQLKFERLCNHLYLNGRKKYPKTIVAAYRYGKRNNFNIPKWMFLYIIGSL